MKLLDMIKSVCLLVSVVVASDVYAMELAAAYKDSKLCPSSQFYKDSSELYVREFPLMSFNLARYRYNRCDDAAKNDIVKKFADKKDEYSGVFIVATQMPQDMCHSVAKQMFDNNKWAVKQFLNTPIKQRCEFFERYPWVDEARLGRVAQHFWDCIYKDKNAITLIEKKIQRIIQDSRFLFQYYNEIKAVDSCFAVDTYYNTREADRSVLEALDILNNKIKEIGKSIGDQNASLSIDKKFMYRHYDTYTMANFLNKLRNRDEVLFSYACFVAIIATTWLSRCIELNCQKILTEGDIQQNKEIILFNEGLRRVMTDNREYIEEQFGRFRQATWQYESYIEGNLFFKDPREIIEPYYSWSDYFKTNLPFFSVVPLVACASQAVKYYKNKQFHSFFSPWLSFSDKVIEASGTFFGVGGVLMLLSLLRRDNFPVGFLGVFSGVSAGFLGLACIKTLIDMRSVRWSSVKVEDIPELLKNRRDGHIVIE